jgi:RimJ/RimL family protein N-acetyltransferase
MNQQEVIEQMRKKHFPLKMENGYTGEIATLQEGIAAATELWGEVFGPTNEGRGLFQTPPERMPVEQRMISHYISTMHNECIIARDSTGKIVGFFGGEAEDNMTFYLRNGGLLPEARRRGLMQFFMPRFVAYLKDLGYERVSSEHYANNSAVLIAMLKSGFYISGLNMDERSGALVKLVLLLKKDRREGFESVFRLPSFDPNAPGQVGAPTEKKTP